jgi:hypothetical protein
VADPEIIAGDLRNKTSQARYGGLYLQSPLGRQKQKDCDIWQDPVSKNIIRHQWLIPVILATWKAEIGRIVIPSQPRQIVREILISKITRAKWT